MPLLASYTMAFALQLRKKHGKASVRVAASNDDDDDDDDDNNNNNNNTGHTNLTGRNSDFVPICPKFQIRQSQNRINP